MNLKIPNKDIDVRFRYSDDGITTFAHIKMTVDGVVSEYAGAAVKSEVDQHCRRVGRKIALARALRDNRFNFDKELRTAIWAGLQKRGMKL